MAPARILAVSILAAVGCARPHVAAPPLRIAEPAEPVEAFADPQRRAKLAAAFTAIDAVVDQQKTKQNLPSLVVGVVIDGELAYQKAVGTRDLARPGPVDADTLYRIGSITKTFTGLAILQLRDDGKLALDDPATRYLPELAALNYPTRDSPPVTLRHLLTHASGLPTLGVQSALFQSDHEITEAEMLAGLSTITMVAPPGSRSNYSNYGFGLLGLVVKRVSGTRYRDYVNGAILAPLGMSASRWSPDGVPPERLATPYERAGTLPRAVAPWRLGEIESAGGLYSSLRDLARYVAFQLDAYPPRNDPERGPARRSTVREAHTLQRPSDLSVTVRDGNTIAANAGGVGLAWHGRQTCEVEQIVGHSGRTEGYVAAVRLLPQQGVGLIALANYQDGELSPILDGAMEALARSGGLAPRVLAPSQLLTRAMTRSLDLYEDFREQEYSDLFAPSFRASYSPGRVVELVQQLKTVHGRCRRETLVPMTIESPTSGTFFVPCERGWLEWHLAMGPGGRIVESTLLPHEGQTPAQPPTGRCRAAN